MWEMTGVPSELILLSHMLDRVYLKGVQEDGKHSLVWKEKKKLCHTCCSFLGAFFSLIITFNSFVIPFVFP